MGSLTRKRSAVIRLIIMVVPAVLAIVVVFLFLSESIMLDLSKERLTLRSQNYSDSAREWSKNILDELNVYRDIIGKEGGMTDSAKELLIQHSGSHEEYPYGLYWGNENDEMFDAAQTGINPGYTPTTRDWYIDGRAHEKFIFGEPYIDDRTGAPCVTASAKLDSDGVKGVIAADVFFDFPQQLTDSIISEGIENAFFVSARNRIIVADSRSEWTGLTLTPDIDIELYSSIFPLINSGFTGLTEVNGGGSYFVNISRVEDVDWFFVTCVKHDVMIRTLRQVTGYVFLFALIACAVLLFLTQHALKAFGDADREARTDALTGLLNRDGLRAAMRIALKNFPGQGVLIMIDVDNFKMVNDRLGHPAGDEFLRQLSSLISEYFNRNKDVTARLGGDEFAVFVGRKIGRDETASMLSKFMRCFHNTFDEQYADQNLSVSIGASFVGSVGGNSNIADVYQSADKALYRAKNNGKDRFVMF